ncbi:MAG: RagB/SusD family nutrient uptake outer membrane protein [Bacteroidales bacterium]
MKINKILLSFVMLGLMLGSCEEDFLETAPTDALSSNVMFDSFEGAQLALNGMYARMFYYDGDGLGHHGAGYFGNYLDIDKMGEDMIRWDRGYGWYTDQYGWLAHRNADSGVVAGRWLLFYELINNANIILFYIDDLEDAPAADVANVKAQALVMRALSYHWLVQKHAIPYHVDNGNNPGVPIYTEPSQEGNPRSSVADVYARIDQDIQDAIDYFNETGSPMAQEHSSHSTLAVAYGLQARVALTKHDYETAISAADEAIALSGALFSPGQFEEDPHALFNDAGQSEWMWGVRLNDEQSPIYASFQSHMDARFMSYASLGNSVQLNHELYDGMSETDVRRNLWVAPEEEVEGDAFLMAYNNKKFLSKEIGSFVGDIPIMRVAEMHLIKAEAAARAGQDGVAQDAINNFVEHRDPEFEGTTATGDDLIEEIMTHRRIEMWGEGFRFFDLKRTDTPLHRTEEQGHNMGLANIHDVDPGDPRWQWLIPQDEIDANDEIGSGDQNP